MKGRTRAASYRDMTSKAPESGAVEVIPRLRFRAPFTKACSSSPHEVSAFAACSCMIFHPALPSLLAGCGPAE
ncbi:MAG: hypothetical protein UDM29_03145 [Dialister sp.]|nr:hypothetical protein [Dialister sp.]